MSEDDQDNIRTNAYSKNNGGGQWLGGGRRRNNDLSLFDVLDRDYYEIFKSSEGKRSRFTFSRLTYFVGLVIFIVGVIEGSVALQFTQFRSLNDFQSDGIVLLSALVISIVFIGFGKGVELIIFRR